MYQELLNKNVRTDEPSPCLENKKPRGSEAYHRKNLHYHNATLDS